MTCQGCSLWHTLKLFCFSQRQERQKFRNILARGKGKPTQNPQQKHLLYEHKTFRWTEGDETLSSSILGFTAMWDAEQGQKFPRGFIASCHKKSDAFNCYRQKCILWIPSLTFGPTPVINLAWLTCSWVARLIIAKVLISQRRENRISCSSVQEPRLGMFSGNETPWKANL